jgi:hypothetical protein
LPEPAHEPPAETVRPTVQEAERALAIASVIDDENLREQVQKAVALSLARGRGDPSI